MLKLELKVPADRNSLATATLKNGDKVIHSDHAVASATPAIAQQRGNASCDPHRLWGHPPLGRYQMLGQARASGAQQAEYGGTLFLFDPAYGAASLAVAHGRMGLLVYGGALGADNRMRRTQGGIRLSNKMIAAIQKNLGTTADLQLALEELQQHAGWKFWRSKITTPALSATVPQVKTLAPPNDEVSLIDALLKRFPRKAAYGSSPDTHDDYRDNRRDDSNSYSNNDSSSSRSTEPFQGGGGQSGGGGASGGWDNSGRIPTAAAAGAAAALAVGAVVATAAVAGSNKFDAGDGATGTSTSTRY